MRGGGVIARAGLRVASLAVRGPTGAGRAAQAGPYLSGAPNTPTPHTNSPPHTSPSPPSPRRSKFTYVVASQVYGANRGAATAKGRWLARGVDLLLHQYPSLRVAFIDTLHGQVRAPAPALSIRG